MGKDIKIRLLEMGKKQVDLLAELRENGFPNLYESQLSKYISGRDKSPQAIAVLKLVEEILTKWEAG